MSLGFWVALLLGIIGLLLCFTFPLIAFLIVFTGGGFLILFVGIRALKKGSIGINTRTKLVVYNRQDNPLEYWFYILFAIILGCLFSWLGVYFPFHGGKP